MLIEDVDKTSDWKFISYEKIAEGIDRLKLSVEDYRYLKKYEWVVTEKIHGSNFAVITDGINIRYAKRKEMLLSDDNFFNHRVLVNIIIGKVEKVYETILNMEKSTERITIYGELFGGYYPHAEVAVNREVEAVQTGVYYSPDIEFCAFDIAVESGNERKYLDYNIAVNIFEKAGLMYAKPLFKGSFEKASDYPVGFESNIPQLLGLPPLNFENKAEGIVIKPVKPVFIKTAKGIARPIIKKKIAEFEEESRFHGANNWSTKYSGYAVCTDEMLESIISEIRGMINKNRLNNVISKVGRIHKSEYKNELTKQLLDDAFESFNSKYDNYLTLLNQKQVGKLQDALKEEIDKLLSVGVDIIVSG
ncbi:RNA ligase family protein [Pseudobacteroides cellulosolvens]|uniref:RNA ligase domain, REL/Rln2 n=1 Tax=Pseudobacteroides cellulosolvens ATCC 35603 = DSM 2933 TaxID=398512 RepID=A0A0L6JTK8_9FIRM|nr:RNA ligase family protein [Pseudobacteroides cellulosolvens]KNY29186.1 RNA ligase domain, REL/Rln2 [Pseudobacteroides cellulosolvens ATCC 35603 = DSM 2933]